MLIQGMGWDDFLSLYLLVILSFSLRASYTFLKYKPSKFASVTLCLLQCLPFLGQ